METQIDNQKFSCSACAKESLLSEIEVVYSGARAYLKCPACGFEESDADYSHRRRLEESFLAGS